MSPSLRGLTHSQVISIPEPVSATGRSEQVEDLARISLRPGPLYINVDEEKQFSTVEGLEQGYILCEADKRFLLLFSFLQKMQKKKVRLGRGNKLRSRPLSSNS